MAYLTGFDRKQAQMFPSCIEELIPADAEVRIIYMYADTMDITQLGLEDKLNVQNMLKQ